MPESLIMNALQRMNVVENACKQEVNIIHIYTK